MRWLSFILALLLLGCSSVRPSEKFAIGCAALDVGTTGIGIEQGLQEANPIMADRPIIYGVAASVGLHYLLRALDAPDWTWWLYGGMRCSAGVYNLGEF